MKNKLIVLSGILLPVAALAQTTGGKTTCVGGSTISTVEGLLCKLSAIFSLVVPVLIALGVIYFIWGVITYVVSGDEEAKKKGRSRMVWGIVGMAVIIALWGLVKILTNTFVGPNPNIQNINFPTVPPQ